LLGRGCCGLDLRHRADGQEHCGDGGRSSRPEGSGQQSAAQAPARRPARPGNFDGDRLSRIDVGQCRAVCQRHQRRHVGVLGLDEHPRGTRQRNRLHVETQRVELGTQPQAVLLGVGGPRQPDPVDLEPACPRDHMGAARYGRRDSGVIVHLEGVVVEHGAFGRVDERPDDVGGGQRQPQHCAHGIPFGRVEPVCAIYRASRDWCYSSDRPRRWERIAERRSPRAGESPILPSGHGEITA
jgi:hypothetical protein